MLEFILARYNYWIVIVLMMTGLYIVFARGNLVKTIIGLNLFQTSVFIFYITIGKVIGGTAPILVAGHGGADHKGDHSSSYGDDHSKTASHHSDVHAEAMTAHEAEAIVGDDHVNNLDHQESGAVVSAEPAAESLHLAPDGLAGNELFQVSSDGHGAAAHHAEGAVKVAAEVAYSNPLPHVLILTAIVVGVATTAVGLAIAVRIREAYGTVEEDDLEEMDNKAALAEASL